MTKIKYITQIKARPPTFVLVTNQESLPQPYERFITGKLRSDFGLHGVPMRLVVRKSKASTGESSRAETYKRRRRVAAQTQRGGRFK
jgi:predicted GTPase